MPAEGGAAPANIDRNVEHFAFDHPQKLRLAEASGLVVKAPNYAVARLALVVLHEADRTHSSGEIPFGERLEEVSAAVSEDAGLDDYDAFYLCLYDVHLMRDIHSARESLQ